jgi:hypothetical protein
MPPTNVVADAQFTLAAILKPFRGFEDRYQGKDPNIPIPFFQTVDGKREVLDPSAGQPGFSPDLLRYLNVPLGSRILLWVPMIGLEKGGVVFLAAAYEYMLHWRLRSVGDANRDHTTFHLRDQAPGQPSGLAPRFVIPGATRALLFHQAEPPLEVAASSHLRREFISIFGGGQLPFDLSLPRPLLPGPGDRRGDYEQGILNPIDFPISRSDALSIFVPFWVDCEGDQLLVTVQRGQNLVPAWGFAPGEPDEAFGNFYGTGAGKHAEFDDVGIYMMTGTNP